MAKFYGILVVLYLFSTVKKDPFHHMTDQELLARYYEDHNNEWLGYLLQRYTLLLLPGSIPSPGTTA